MRLTDAQGQPRTPVLFFELPASGGKDGTPAPASGQTVLMYGHLDKQPEFTGWRNDLGPWTPKIEDGKLYGRGGADDGYAVYASIAAIQAIQGPGRGASAHRRPDRDLRRKRFVAICCRMWMRCASAWAMWVW